MSSLVNVKDIKLYKNSAVLRLTQGQAKALAVAIAKSMREMKHMFEGIKIMTIPVLNSKILVTVFNSKKEAKKK